MNRMAIETIRDVLNRSKTKIVLESQTPFDLTFPASRGDRP